MSQQATLDYLMVRVHALTARPERPLYLGIDGEGGAGKSTLALRIAAAVDGSCIVRLDDFARPGVAGWDQSRFEWQVLEPLRTRRDGYYQRWDWDRDVGAEWHVVPRDSVVLIEGVSATRVELAVPWALTVWVDTPRALRLARGVERDGEQMRAQWEQLWMPEEDAYVAAQSPHLRADFVVRGH